MTDACAYRRPIYVCRVQKNLSLKKRVVNEQKVRSTRIGDWHGTVCSLRLFTKLELPLKQSRAVTSDNALQDCDGVKSDMATACVTIPPTVSPVRTDNHYVFSQSSHQCISTVLRYSYYSSMEQLARKPDGSKVLAMFTEKLITACNWTYTIPRFQ